MATLTPASIGAGASRSPSKCSTVPASPTTQTSRALVPPTPRRLTVTPLAKGLHPARPRRRIVPPLPTAHASESVAHTACNVASDTLLTALRQAVPSQCSNAPAPTAHTSSRAVPQTSVRSLCVPLANSCHLAPFQCRITPLLPTTQKSSSAAPQIERGTTRMPPPSPAYIFGNSVQPDPFQALTYPPDACETSNTCDSRVPPKRRPTTSGCFFTSAVPSQ
jgi:hypothetical protein